MLKSKRSKNSSTRTNAHHSQASSVPSGPAGPGTLGHGKTPMAKRKLKQASKNSNRPKKQQVMSPSRRFEKDLAQFERSLAWLSNEKAGLMVPGMNVKPDQQPQHNSNVNYPVRKKSDATRMSSSGLPVRSISEGKSRRTDSSQFSTMAPAQPQEDFLSNSDSESEISDDPVDSKANQAIGRLLVTPASGTATPIFLGGNPKQSKTDFTNRRPQSARVPYRGSTTSSIPRPPATARPSTAHTSSNVSKDVHKHSSVQSGSLNAVQRKAEDLGHALDGKSGELPLNWWSHFEYLSKVTFSFWDKQKPSVSRHRMQSLNLMPPARLDERISENDEETFGPVVEASDPFSRASGMMKIGIDLNPAIPGHIAPKSSFDLIHDDKQVFSPAVLASRISDAARRVLGATAANVAVVDSQQGLMCWWDLHTVGGGEEPSESSVRYATVEMGLTGRAALTAMPQVVDCEHFQTEDFEFESRADEVKSLWPLDERVDTSLVLGAVGDVGSTRELLDLSEQIVAIPCTIGELSSSYLWWRIDSPGEDVRASKLPVFSASEKPTPVNSSAGPERSENAASVKCVILAVLPIGKSVQRAQVALLSSLGKEAALAMDNCIRQRLSSFRRTWSSTVSKATRVLAARRTVESVTRCACLYACAVLGGKTATMYLINNKKSSSSSRKNIRQKLNNSTADWLQAWGTVDEINVLSAMAARHKNASSAENHNMTSPRTQRLVSLGTIGAGSETESGINFDRQSFASVTSKTPADGQANTNMSTISTSGMGDMLSQSLNDDAVIQALTPGKDLGSAVTSGAKYVGDDDEIATTLRIPDDDECSCDELTCYACEEHRDSLCVQDGVDLRTLSGDDLMDAVGWAQKKRKIGVNNAWSGFHPPDEVGQSRSQQNRKRKDVNDGDDDLADEESLLDDSAFLPAPEDWSSALVPPTGNIKRMVQREAQILLACEQFAQRERVIARMAASKTAVSTEMHKLDEKSAASTICNAVRPSVQPSLLFSIPRSLAPDRLGLAKQLADSDDDDNEEDENAERWNGEAVELVLPHHVEALPRTSTGEPPKMISADDRSMADAFKSRRLGALITDQTSAIRLSVASQLRGGLPLHGEVLLPIRSESGQVLGVVHVQGVSNVPANEVVPGISGEALKHARDLCAAIAMGLSRVEDEQSMKELNARLPALRAEMSPSTVFQQLCTAMKSFVNASHVFLLHVDRATNTLFFKRTDLQEKEDQVTVTLPIKLSPVKDVASKLRIVNVRTGAVENDFRHRIWIEALGRVPLHVLMVPIHTANGNVDSKERVSWWARRMQDPTISNIPAGSHRLDVEFRLSDFGDDDKELQAHDKLQCVLMAVNSLNGGFSQNDERISSKLATEASPIVSRALECSRLVCSHDSSRKLLDFHMSISQCPNLLSLLMTAMSHAKLITDSEHCRIFLLGGANSPTPSNISAPKLTRLSSHVSRMRELHATEKDMKNSEQERDSDIMKEELNNYVQLRPASAEFRRAFANVATLTTAQASLTGVQQLMQLEQDKENVASGFGGRCLDGESMAIFADSATLSVFTSRIPLSHERVSDSDLLEGERKLVFEVPLNTGLPGFVARTGRTIRLAKARDHQFFSSMLERRIGVSVTSTCLIPLYMPGSSDKIMGVIQVCNKRKGEPYSLADEENLKEMAAHTSASITNFEKLEKSMFRSAEMRAMSRRRGFAGGAGTSLQVQPWMGDHIMVDALNHALRLLSSNSAAIYLLPGHEPPEPIDPSALHTLLQNKPSTAANALYVTELTISSGVVSRVNRENKGIVHRVLETGKRILSNKPTSLSFWDSSVDSHGNGPYSVAIVPLVSPTSKLTIGALMVSNKYSLLSASSYACRTTNHAEYDQDDMSVLSEFGQHVVLALEKKWFADKLELINSTARALPADVPLETAVKSFANLGKICTHCQSLQLFEIDMLSHAMYRIDPNAGGMVIPSGSATPVSVAGSVTTIGKVNNAPSENEEKRRLSLAHPVENSTEPNPQDFHSSSARKKIDDLQSALVGTEFDRTVESSDCMLEIPWGSGVVGLCAASNDIQISHNVNSTLIKTFLPGVDAPEHIRAQNLCVVPLHNRGGYISLIAVGINKSHGEWNQDDVKVLQVLGSYATNVLRNAQTLRRTVYQARRNLQLCQFFASITGQVCVEHLVKSASSFLSNVLDATDVFLLLRHPRHPRRKMIRVDAAGQVSLPRNENGIFQLVTTSGQVSNLLAKRVHVSDSSSDERMAVGFELTPISLSADIDVEMTDSNGVPLPFEKANAEWKRRMEAVLRSNSTSSNGENSHSSTNSEGVAVSAAGLVLIQAYGAQASSVLDLIEDRKASQLVQGLAPNGWWHNIIAAPLISEKRDGEIIGVLVATNKPSLLDPLQRFTSEDEDTLKTFSDALTGCVENLQSVKYAAQSPFKAMLSSMSSMASEDGSPSPRRPGSAASRLADRLKKSDSRSPSPTKQS